MVCRKVVSIVTLNIPLVLKNLVSNRKLTVEEGGQAVYKIEIVEASNNSFLARATSVSDLDGDGAFNTWEIDHKKVLTEVVKE